MAPRLKGLGIKLLVDFHYSDNWADPGKQIKPAAWKDYDFEQLRQAVYDHTFDVCSSLVAQGTPPDMVHVGNEINAGLLWPDGDYNHFDNMAALLKDGYRAVKDSFPSTLVMLHIAEGGDNDMARWWFGNITRREVPFDVIGISYYPYWHGSLGQLIGDVLDLASSETGQLRLLCEPLDLAEVLREAAQNVQSRGVQWDAIGLSYYPRWHGSLSDLDFNIDSVSARYDKEVIIVETAYPWTTQNGDLQPNVCTSTGPVSYPMSPAGQVQFLNDLVSRIKAVPNGKGKGFFYWEPEWIPVEGAGWKYGEGDEWDNVTLFDFDGNALSSLDAFLDW
jgi:arabinogalactan endo-1,4-beta-galactosidase